MAGTLASPRLLGAIDSNLAATPIKLGQIGVEHAHATKLSVYRQSPDYEVVGVVEPDRQVQNAARNQSAFAGLPWLNQDQLLSMPDVQVVLVETHVRNSLAVAQAAIDAGKHVHLDKPAGHDMPAYQRLMAAARNKNLMVQMGYMYRYNPAVLLLKQFLAAGWLGEIHEVHAVIGKGISAAERKQLAEFPGGIMFELGCHLIDLVVGVIGAGSRITNFNQHVMADGLADNMLAVFELPKTLATVKVSALEVEGGARRHLVVCGSQGTFHIQPLDNPVATISLKADHRLDSTASPKDDQKPGSDHFKAGIQTRSFEKFVRYVADAADMAQVIRGQKASDYSYDHDLEVQRCVLAAG